MGTVQGFLDFKSAEASNWNRQATGTTPALEVAGTVQNTILRYSRLEICVTRAWGSPRNVCLFQRTELMPAQCLLGGLVVLHAQTDDRLALRLGNQGIEVVDVEFGLEERPHQPIE